MILKFKGIRDKYAIGLRWAVDTREGIELIAQTTGLSYGIVLKLQSSFNKKLKSFALAKEDHLNTISLAGVFSRTNENLVFVHRLNDYHYWLCIILEGEVWSGIDLPKATAGDFVGEVSKVQDIIESAKVAFEKVGVELGDISYCSDVAHDEFLHFHSTGFVEKIIQARKYRRDFRVRYIESAGAVTKKIFMLGVILCLVCAGGYYTYHQRLITQLIHKQEIAERKAAQMAAAQKKRYFANLDETLHQQWGYKVIGDLMHNFQYLDMGSKGWVLENATFNADKPRLLDIALRREVYGTVDSFKYAYTSKGQEGVLDKNNNAGTKTISFPAAAGIASYVEHLSSSELVGGESSGMSKLVSYMQVRGAGFTFNVGKQAVSKYGVHEATFTVAANALWELVKLQSVLKDYKTVVVHSITFTVHNYEMSWELSGEVYA